MRWMIFVSLFAVTVGPWFAAQFAPQKTGPMAATSRAQESDPLPTVQLMDDEREAKFRGYFPTVSDPAIQAILDSPSTLLYTSREIPKAYQQWDGALPGVHAVSYNISADDSEPFGNGNLEFPWRGPAGTHGTRGVESFKFLSLPRDEEGKPYPVVWFRHRYRGDDREGYAWVFPAGTIVGECLTMATPSGGRIAFELRIRRRNRDDWEVDVFRPFPTDQDLISAIKHARPEWDKSESVGELVRHLETPDRLAVDKLVDDHPQPSFIQTMGVDRLPQVGDEDLVVELLEETPFRSAHGARWSENATGEFTAAPTTDADFHVIPRGFSGGFVEVDETSCLRCHETVGKHVRHFEFGRDWYGRIRGSDGIFSFHPFSRSSISFNGMGNTVTMNRDLLSAGIVAQFDPDVHVKERYRKLSFLGE